jgi:hypothetical protein
MIHVFLSLEFSFFPNAQSSHLETLMVRGAPPPRGFAEKALAFSSAFGQNGTFA